MKRILFAAENVTLAQVVRLAQLARGLDPERYETHFACSEFDERIFSPQGPLRHSLYTLNGRKVDAAVRNGKSPYDERTLEAYVEAEKRLIREVKPDLVVGDFRLSLSTSAELEGVASATLINAYWSPFAVRDEFPVPDHPIIGVLGESLTRKYFPRAIPRVFRHFAEPLNRVRRRLGLAPVGALLEALTHGTFTLYPDDPVLTPVTEAPPAHRFIGPVCWQPDQPSREVNLEIGDRPLVYATLGSSGRADLWPRVIEALSSLPVAALVATAGRFEPGQLPDNVVAVDFARGAEAARAARLVVSNGGSTTGYQALGQGTPVVGIPSNFDQYLATQAIVRAGAGLEVKARQASVDRLRRAIWQGLRDDGLQAGARAVAARFRQHDSRRSFAGWLDAVLA